VSDNEPIFVEARRNTYNTSMMNREYMDEIMALHKEPDESVTSNEDVCWDIARTFDFFEATPIYDSVYQPDNPNYVKPYAPDDSTLVHYAIKNFWNDDPPTLREKIMPWLGPLAIVAVMATDYRW
jgi:hypothetical protein